MIRRQQENSAFHAHPLWVCLWVCSGSETPSACALSLSCLCWAARTHSRADQKWPREGILSNGNRMRDLSQCHCGERKSPGQKGKHVITSACRFGAGGTKFQNPLSFFTSFPLLSAHSASAYAGTSRSSGLITLRSRS